MVDNTASDIAQVPQKLYFNIYKFFIDGPVYDFAKM